MKDGGLQKRRGLSKRGFFPLTLYISHEHRMHLLVHIIIPSVRWAVSSPA